MTKEVYANGREVFTKKSKSKTILPTIDVCHTPPPPPPMVPPKIGIPIPYPNFSVAKNMDKGSTTVKHKNQMIAKKNKSFIKTSDGNETATSQFKKGIINHKIEAKTIATSWSFDVRVEKKNVVRHMDSTKNNA